MIEKPKMHKTQAHKSGLPEDGSSSKSNTTQKKKWNNIADYTPLHTPLLKDALKKEGHALLERFMREQGHL